MQKSSSELKSFNIKTLGCKLNQSEGDSIQEELQGSGLMLKDFQEEVDLSIINTCTVTNDADSKSRAAIRSAIRQSPQARIVVTGCYAQIKPEEIKSIEGVNLILGSQEKYKILDYLKELGPDPDQCITHVKAHEDDFLEGSDAFISASTRTRAFLKVQEGCDYYCSYCIIPFARGKARSRNIANSVEEAKRLVEKGFQELVLTGINIGTFKDGERKLYHLLAELEKIPGLNRIRISSIEPNTVDDELLKLIANSEIICQHLHIPLQAGNDEILQAMNRKYSLEDYTSLLERINRLSGQVALGTDIIVGFPGESEDHFRKTLEFLELHPFTYFHVFRYSDRTGTVASRLENHIDSNIIKDRSKILLSLSQKKKTAFSKCFETQEKEVLFEQCHENQYSGYTDEYLRVQVDSKEDLRNKIAKVKLGKWQGNCFQGQILREI